MTSYDEKDAAKDTGVKVKEVKAAYHFARGQSQKEGSLPERKENKSGNSNKKK